MKESLIFWPPFQKAGLIGALLLLTTLLLCAPGPRLQVFDPGPAHDGLIDALRIRLGARLTERPALRTQELPQQLREAQSQIEAGTTAAWVHTSSVGLTSVVLARALDTQNNEPAIERITLEGRPGFDRDRATALKIIEWLAVSDPQPPRPATRPAQKTPSWPRAGLSIEAGGLGWVQDQEGGLRGGLYAAVAPQLKTPRWRFDLRSGAQWITNLRRTSPENGTVRVREWAWLLSVSALLRGQSFDVGPAVGTHLRVVHARGTTATGTSGTETLFLPTLSAGADLRHALSKRWTARLFVGAGLNLQRRQLAVNDLPLLDLGRWFGLVQISLLISAL